MNIRKSHLYFRISKNFNCITENTYLLPVEEKHFQCCNRLYKASPFCSVPRHSLPISLSTQLFKISGNIIYPSLSWSTWWSCSYRLFFISSYQPSQPSWSYIALFIFFFLLMKSNARRGAPEWYSPYESPVLILNGFEYLSSTVI